MWVSLTKINNSSDACTSRSYVWVTDNRTTWIRDELAYRPRPTIVHSVFVTVGVSVGRVTSQSHQSFTHHWRQRIVYQCMMLAAVPVLTDTGVRVHRRCVCVCGRAVSRVAQVTRIALCQVCSMPLVASWNSHPAMNNTRSLPRRVRSVENRLIARRAMMLPKAIETLLRAL